MIVRIELWHNSKAQYGIAMHKTGETYLMGAKNEILDELRRLATEIGFFCTILRDYGGNDRVAELRRANITPPA